MVLLLSFFWFDIRAPAGVNTRFVYCICNNSSGFGNYISGRQCQAEKNSKTNNSSIRRNHMARLESLPEPMRKHLADLSRARGDTRGECADPIAVRAGPAR